jgi:CrcB protein
MRAMRFDPGRLAAIYVGGVVGALARVGLAQAAPHAYGAWPWATFAVNLAGAFLLGCLIAALRGHRAESHGFALLTTGVCGTLTTFATFQLELYGMLDAGNIGLALLYAGTTLAAGYLLLVAGLRVGRPGAFPSSGAGKATGGEG